MKLNTKYKIFNDLLFFITNHFCRVLKIYFRVSFAFSIFHFSSRSIASHILLSFSLSRQHLHYFPIISIPFQSPLHCLFFSWHAMRSPAFLSRVTSPPPPSPLPLSAPQFSMSFPIALEDFPTGMCLHLFKHSIIYTHPRHRTCIPLSPGGIDPRVVSH